MSGYRRICVAVSLLFAGLSSSPALSNPLTDLFNPPPAEAPAAAPAPAAREQCLSQPGRATAGQHWVYHLDGHRKCWFQTAETAVSVKRLVRHRTAKQPAIASEENEAELRKKPVADARAQLLSAAPDDAPQAAPSAPAPVDTASASTADIAAPPVAAAPVLAQPAPVAAAPILAQPAPVTAAPVLAQHAIDQPTPGHAAPHSVDVDMLLAEVPPPRDTASSAAPPALSGASSMAAADESRWESTATRAGMALIALGLVSLLAGLLRARRFRDPRAARGAV